MGKEQPVKKPRLANDHAQDVAALRESKGIHGDPPEAPPRLPSAVDLVAGKVPDVADFFS